MKVNKFEKDNCDSLYCIAREAALIGLPIKKSLGYADNTCLSDEIDFIHDQLMIPSLEIVLDEGEKITWLESGWYRVEVEKEDNEIDIRIFFTLTEINYKI